MRAKMLAEKNLIVPALLTGRPQWYLAHVKWARAHFFVGVAKRIFGFVT